MSTILLSSFLSTFQQFTLLSSTSPTPPFFSSSLSPYHHLLHSPTSLHPPPALTSFHPLFNTSSTLHLLILSSTAASPCFLIEITFVSTHYIFSKRPASLLVFKLSWDIFYTIYVFEPFLAPFSSLPHPQSPHMFSCVYQYDIFNKLSLQEGGCELSQTSTRRVKQFRKQNS